MLFLALTTFVNSATAFAQTDLPQHFTLDGRLFEPGSSTDPLLDSSTILTIQVLNPTKSCILYEEQQPVNTLGTNGFFTIRVGSATGDSKRTSLDRNNSMNTVFYNRTTAINGKTSGGSNCTYTPSAGEERFFRFFVQPSSAGAPVQLSDDMAINSVPQAIVAQTLQGLGPGDVFKTSPTSTQTKLDNLLTTSYSDITDLIAGTSTNYLKNDATGTVIPNRTTDPLSPVDGQMWFDTNTNQLRYFNGTTIENVGNGTGVVSITAGQGLDGGTITGTGTIDLADSGVTTVKIDDEAVTTAKLADASVTEVKLANDAITTAKINNLAVTNAKLATGIDASKITMNTLPASVVPTGTDDTKLPLAGGALSGTLTMGDETQFAGFDLLATGHITMSGQKTITIGRYTSAQQTALVGTLSTLNAGALWFNVDTGKMMYWSGSQAYELSETTGAGGDITAVNTNTGSGLTGGNTSGPITLAIQVDGTTIEIATNTVRVKDAGIGTMQLADTSVTEVKLASSAVTTAKLADASVTEVKLANNAVTSAKVANGAVTTAKLDDEAVTPAKLADDAVTSGKILDATILNSDISPTAAIAWSKIDKTGASPADIGAVATGRIIGTAAGSGLSGGGDLSVDRSLSVNVDNTGIEINSNALRLKDAGVSTAKLADTSVTEVKLANSAVTTAKIADDAVTSAKIANGTITSADVDVISYGKLGNAAGEYLNYMPAGTECATGQVLKWDATNDRWLCDNDTGGVTDHGLLSGLTDDDHTQYVMLVGRAGGQNIRGGMAASENLTLESTSNGTKGHVLLQPNGGNVGIGTTNPLAHLHVQSSEFSGTQFRLQKGTAVMSLTQDDTNGYIAGGSNGTLFIRPEGPAGKLTLMAGGGVMNSHLTSTGFGVNITPVNKLDVNGAAAIGFNYAGVATAPTDGLIVAGNVGIGTSDPQSQLDVAGRIRAEEICDESGSNCKDLSSGWGGGGDIDGVTTHATTSGLSGGTASGTANLAVVTDNSTIEINGSNQVQIKNLGVTTGKLADGSVTELKLGADSVTSAKIANGTIVNADISGTAAIAWSKIDKTGAVPGDIGAATSTRTIATNAGSAMSGGGDLSADRSLSVNVDNTGIEINSNALRLKDAGVSTAKLADTSVTEVKLANSAVTSAKIADGTITSADVDVISYGKLGNAPGEYLNYMPAGTECATGQVLKWDATNDRWLCDNDTGGVTDHGLLSGLTDDDHTQYVMLAGRTGGQTLRGGTAANNNLTLDSTSDTTKGYVILQPTGGNVGIGTAAPSTSLEVNSNSTANVGVANFRSTANPTGESWTYANLIKNNGSTTTLYGGAIGGFINQGVSSGVGIFTYAGTSTPVEAVRVMNSGNVGIGSINPQAKLDVAGTIRATELCDETGNNCKDISGGWAAGGGGDVQSTRAINTNSGSALSGGGNLSADRNLQVVVDNTGIEINTNALRLKDSGVTNAKLAPNAVDSGKIADGSVTSADIADGTIVSADVANVSVGKITNAAAEYFSYMPAGTECATGEVLKWNATNDRWLCDTDSAGVTDHGLLTGLLDDDHTQYVMLAGRAGGQNIRGGTAASNNLILESTSHATKGDVLLQPNGGNVSIGTTGPSGMSAGRTYFSVRGTTGAGVLELQSAAADADATTQGLLQWTDSNSTSIDKRIAIIHAQTDGATANDRGGKLLFVTKPNGGTSQTRMVIGQNGNVGIGTTVPGNKVEVVNKVHDATVPGEYVMSVTNAHNATLKYGLIVGTNWASSENFVANFGNYTAIGGSFSSYMAIKGNGYVGIGSASPNSMLDVAGTVRAQQLCDEAGANCKDLSSGWGSGGDIDGIVTHATTSGLSGGTASGTATLAVVTDNSSIEVNGTNQVQIKNLGVTNAKLAANAVDSAKIADGSVTSAKIADGTIVSADIANVSVGKITNAAAEYFSYMPAGTECATGQVLKWNATSDRWLCDNDIDTNTTDHGTMTGLLDDDHTQYVMLAGRSGGQNLRGGTAASNSLTLESTSNATKGFVILQPNGGNVGIGTTNPSAQLDVRSAASTEVSVMSTSGANYPKVRVANYGTGNPELAFSNGRGSFGAATVTQQYDWLGLISATGHKNANPSTDTNDRGNAGILFDADSTFTTTSHPTNVHIFTTPALSQASAIRMTVAASGNVGIGSTNPQSLLDVAGRIRAQEICDETGSNCRDISTGWGGGGDVMSTRAINTNTGSGLSGGGNLTADRSLQVVVDNTGVEIATNTIRLKDQGVTTAKLADFGVTDTKIASSAVTTLKINDGAVTDTKLAASSVTSAKIFDGTIVDSDINAGAAIGWAKISKTGAVASDIGAVPTSRTISSGAGLTGGGDLTANRTLAVNVDNATVEINTNIVRVKDLGIATAKLADSSVTTVKLANDSVTSAKIDDGTIVSADIANVSVGKITNAAAEYFSYMPAGTECATGQVLKWNATSDRWLCDNDIDSNTTDHGTMTGLLDDDHTQYVMLAGRAGGQNLRGGTAASNNLTLESTSNATKGHVLLQPTAGRVGIGTTAPATHLDVRGSILVDSSGAGTINNTQGAWTMWTAGAGNGYTNFVNHRGSGTGGFRFSDTSDGSTLDDLITITGSGDVEIGNTVSAAGKFGVKQSVDTVLGGVHVQNSAGTGTSIFYVDASNRTHIGGSVSPNAIVVENVNGNVGIGTNSPSNLLHVNGAIRAGGTTGHVTLNGGNASQTGFLAWFKPDGSTRMGYMGWNQNYVNLNLENSSDFVVSGGSVGIGSVNPGHALDVTGTARATNMLVGSNQVWHAGNFNPASYQTDLGYTPVNKAGDTMTGNLTINHASPTVIFQDTDQRSGMIHVNSNMMYVLSGAGVNATTWALNGTNWPIAINLTTDDVTFGGTTTVAEGNFAVTTGTATIGGVLHANGGVSVDGNTVIDNGGGWHRSYGNTGWYNQTHGGGFYMEDATWVKTYGSKGLYAQNGLYVGGVNAADNTYAIRAQTSAAAGGAVLGYSQNGSAYGILGHGNAYAFYGVGDGYFSGGLYTNNTYVSGNAVWHAGNFNPALKYQAGATPVFNNISDSSGNFHLDATAAFGTYINWLGGSGGVVIGNGSATYGPIYASAFVNSSDARLKKDVQPIENPLDMVLGMQGVRFKWKSNDAKDIGFIAQEVEKVAPELVVEDNNKEIKGYKAVKYGNVVSIVVEAIKEFYQRWVETQAENDKRLSALEAENQRMKLEMEMLRAELSEINKKLSTQTQQIRAPAAVPKSNLQK